MRIIVAHPSKQHSFYTATAIYKAGELHTYITTVYDKEGSITRFIKKFLGKVDTKKASTHRCSEIPDDIVVQRYEIDYLICLFLNRFPKLRKYREAHRQYVANKFGKYVAEYAIANNADCVIMYDSTATKCFEILREKAPRIKRILDVSIATRQFQKMNFKTDMKLTGEDYLRKEFPEYWEDKRSKSFQREIEIATGFMVPSQIVKESLVYCGANENTIRIVPYGVDIEKFSYVEREEQSGVRSCDLRIIYVGQVSYRKGIHHLLKVVCDQKKYHIEVDLVGSYDRSGVIYSRYNACQNIHFHGFITRDELAKYYQSADVFVFPTLGEGYGLVVLEAMSCGLPVISSDLAGGNDAIIDGENGLVFRAGDDDDLFRCLEWFIQNQNKHLEMKRKARTTAEGLTWNTYCTNYVSKLHEIV